MDAYLQICEDEQRGSLVCQLVRSVPSPGPDLRFRIKGGVGS